jgi:hypothetical protein
MLLIMISLVATNLLLMEHGKALLQMMQQQLI